MSAAGEVRMPCRVLVVHSSDELYGADRMLLLLAGSLDRQAYSMTVVVPTDLDYEGRLTARLRDAGVTVVPMNLAVLRRSYLRPRRLPRWLVRLVVSTLALRRLIRREGIDLVHSFTTAVLPGALAARLTRTPHVWSAQELVLRPRPVARAVAWLLPRLSGTVVAVSAAMRDHLVAGDAANAGRCVVVRNAVPDPQLDPEQVRAWRARLAGDEGRPLVGTVGRIRPSKGQEVFVRAAAAVAAAHPGARFAVVGDPLPGEEHHLSALRSLVAGLGIADRVAFTGFQDEVSPVLAACDVVVLPSIHPESFGLGVVEAMAAGTAVVASRAGAVPELVEDGVTGLLVAPGDPEALAGALRRLLADPAQRAAIAAAGRRHAETAFAADRFAAEWAGVYRTALARRTGDG